MLTYEPLEVGPYQISRKVAEDGRLHAWVGLSDEEYKLFRALALDIALRRSSKRLAGWFYSQEYEPYWGVSRQLYTVLKEVNRVRREAGLEAVGKSCVRHSRRSVKPFEKPNLVGQLEGEEAA